MTTNFGQGTAQRTCAAADRTGHAMLHTLYQRNVRARTQFFVEWMALDIIRDADGDCCGVIALEMETGEVHILEAKTTLLATGGAGRIFASSTNAFINTGDGLGMDFPNDSHRQMETGLRRCAHASFFIVRA